MALTNKKNLSPSTANTAAESCYCCRNGGSYDFSKKVLLTLFGVLLVYSIFYVGALTRNTLKGFSYVGVAERGERTLDVTAKGRVTAENDIAVTSLGYFSVKEEVSDAEAEVSRVMNKVHAALLKLGVAAEDLETSYSVNPEYNYGAEGREFVGYRANNSLTIKIRDLSKVSAVLGLAGRYGANQVGGLNFTIDDPDNLKSKARDKALAAARVKAVKLADSLGVRLVEFVSFQELGRGGVMPYAKAAVALESAGGGLEPVPVASGSQDVEVEVSVTYRFVSK